MEDRRVIKPTQPRHPPPRARLSPVAKPTARGSGGRGKPTHPIGIRPPPAKRARSEHVDRRLEDRRSEIDERRRVEEPADRRRVEEQPAGCTDDGDWKCTLDELEEWMNVGYTNMASTCASTLSELEVDSDAQRELFKFSQTSPQSYMDSYQIMGKLLLLTRQGKVIKPSAFVHSCVRNARAGHDCPHG